MTDTPKHPRPPHAAPAPAPEPVTGDGYVIRACRGLCGCPLAAAVPDDADALARRTAQALDALHLGDGLRRLHGRALRHHESFTVSISCCPNACSRPQIENAGFIGAARPGLDATACTACGACLEACRESALIHGARGSIEDIDRLSCVACGACAGVCPSGALAIEAKGFRVLAGGRLGRHPRLAQDLSGPTMSRLLDPERIPETAVALARLLLERGRPGERLADVMERLTAKEVRAAVPGLTASARP